jgi:hypothetical protein
MIFKYCLIFWIGFSCKPLREGHRFLQNEIAKPVQSSMQHDMYIAPHEHFCRLESLQPCLQLAEQQNEGEICFQTCHSHYFDEADLVCFVPDLRSCMFDLKNQGKKISKVETCLEFFLEGPNRSICLPLERRKRLFARLAKRFEGTYVRLKHWETALVGAYLIVRASDNFVAFQNACFELAETMPVYEDPNNEVSATSLDKNQEVFVESAAHPKDNQSDFILFVQYLTAEAEEEPKKGYLKTALPQEETDEPKFYRINSSRCRKFIQEAQ